MILVGIESSCDDTSVAVLRDGALLSNVISSQEVHRKYGGVVPELASRAHQQNIIPTASQALKEANVTPSEVSAIAFTRGPGLMGSLLVGTSFAKGWALSLGIPLIEVNHLHAHILAHFVRKEGEEKSQPAFPFLCLLVSGGNSQIVKVSSPYEMTILGQTIDDAAGEAFDKCAKVLGLPYPGGPVIDRLAKVGNPQAFQLAHPHIEGYNYSFSGLKTSFLYHLRDELKGNPNYIQENLNDLCAVLQSTIIQLLMEKLLLVVKDTGIQEVALSGGVSANSGLREAFLHYAEKYGWRVYIPPFAYTTDNAAMVATAGYFKYLKKDFCPLDLPPYSRVRV